MSDIERRVVFILSETKSGSTWLSFVLGSHPGAAHLGEYCRPFLRPGHIACKLCEAKGKPECERLHGIQRVAVQDAFDFAFSRLEKQVLVDCSKRLDWLERFAGSTSFKVGAIHLIRDPRAWFASLKRRNPDLPVEAAMARWVATNTTIRQRLAALPVPSAATFYDDLCVAPDRHFPESPCAILGIPFDRNALAYWNAEHHGLGGNGAAFNTLMGLDMSRMATGDDAFYARHAASHFHDTRWRNELSQVERQAIEHSANVIDCLEQHGRDFAHFDRLIEGA